MADGPGHRTLAKLCGREGCRGRLQQEDEEVICETSVIKGSSATAAGIPFIGTRKARRGSWWTGCPASLTCNALATSNSATHVSRIKPLRCCRTPLPPHNAVTWAWIVGEGVLNRCA